MENLSDGMMLKQKHKETQEAISVLNIIDNLCEYLADKYYRNIPGRRNNKCKSPEMRVS